MAKTFPMPCTHVFSASFLETMLLSLPSSQRSTADVEASPSVIVRSIDGESGGPEYVRLI